MDGLRWVEALTDPAKRPRAELEIAETRRRDEEAVSRPSERPAAAPAAPVRVSRDIVPPAPPDLERHVETLDLDAVWAQLSRQMLYGKHLGLRGSVARLEEAGDPKLAMLVDLVEGLQAECRDGAMMARAVWRFFPARPEGDRLQLLDPEDGSVAAVWTFPRQDGGRGICLTDFVLPEGDHVALFVTTAGSGVRERVERFKHAGEYLRSHGLAALALETAEAAAELLHQRLRCGWGFPDPPAMTLQERLRARYRCKRYSFGYPACPDLEGQEALFTALAPEEIGVELTDGFMMEPEASVSALVLHHPEARYFGV
jgi:5-methyltetrahydrofolate--homocysteine methyltransferase